MKNILYTVGIAISLALVLAFVTPVTTYSTQISMPINAGYSTSKQSGSFVNSRVDTVRWVRESGVQNLCFGASWIDSVSVTKIVLFRAINGVPQAVLAGDTLATAFNSGTSDVTSSAPFVKNYYVTLTSSSLPMPEEYWFVVTYAGTLNGVGTPTVTYIVNKQLGK